MTASDNPPPTSAVLARSSHVSSRFRVLSLILHIFFFCPVHVLCFYRTLTWDFIILPCPPFIFR